MSENSEKKGKPSLKSLFPKKNEKKSLKEVLQKETKAQSKKGKNNCTIF
jgi:hypothetical protein